MRPSPSDASAYPLTPAHPAHTSAHTTRPARTWTPPLTPHSSGCSRGGQPGRPARPGGGAGPLPAEGPAVRSVLWGGSWGGAAAAAPAGGLRRAAQRPGGPRHSHQGERSAGPGLSRCLSRERTRPWLGPAPEPRHLPVHPPGATCILRTGAARPRGSCWIRGRKTPHRALRTGDAGLWSDTVLCPSSHSKASRESCCCGCFPLK